jgi:hypothetical protein
VASVGVVAEDNKRVRYLINKLERLSWRVYLIDIDRRTTSHINPDLDALLVVRDFVSHCIIEKARAVAKKAKVFYLDRSSMTQIDLFCSTFRL